MTLLHMDVENYKWLGDDESHVLESNFGTWSLILW